MKKITLFLGAFLTLFFISCEGPQGPPGFDGFDGFDGENGINGSEFEAAAFEIEGSMILNESLNRYELEPGQYPSDIILLSDDVVLMYRLEEVDNDLDVWRQLPQPFFSGQGLLYYNFDFTLSDYNIFVEPEFDVNLVPVDLVQNQIFRIVIIPANLGASSKMDKSDINAVMRTLGLSEENVIKMD